MFKRIRIAILLFVFATVALSSWRTESRLTQWRTTVHVAVYPMAGDDSSVSSTYLAKLEVGQFQAIEDFLAGEAHRHGLGLIKPVRLSLAPVLKAAPPELPATSGALSAMAWSLKMRWWAWRHDQAPGPRPDIRIFARYYDPTHSPRLPHSVGLREGRIGLVNLFASSAERGSNAVVLTHELLHTLGAKDKYDPVSLQPLFPEGYGEPQREPRFPQSKAEIMAGRIPVTVDAADVPAHLGQTLVGPLTAREIHWSGPDQAGQD